MKIFFILTTNFLKSMINFCWFIWVWIIFVRRLLILLTKSLEWNEIKRWMHWIYQTKTWNNKKIKTALYDELGICPASRQVFRWKCLWSWTYMIFSADKSLPTAAASSDCCHCLMSSFGFDASSEINIFNKKVDP